MMHNLSNKKALTNVLLALAIFAGAETSAMAESYSNKLLLTGGVSQVEGATGGGLTPPVSNSLLL